MIKRALGLHAGSFTGKAGGDSDDDSDEALTGKERKRLERRLLPGMPAAPRSRPSRDSDDDSELSAEGEESEEGSDMDDSDDGMPAAPMGEEKQIRGQFQCQLCPNKILLNEKLLEAHLQSKSHKKMEARFEHAKKIGVKAYAKECQARADAREEAAMKTGPSKKRQKSDTFWEKKRGKAKKKSGQEQSKDLTAAEIEERKSSFQAKKARRLARKAAAEAGTAKGKKAKRKAKASDTVQGKKETKSPAADAPARNKAAPPPPNAAGNRKARRLAKQAAWAAANS
eukprot:gnl/TRDRNA2_/TRDRNA2_69567_c0_seq1.p1 gnl/TRDRNA2_/TRDRNA2_69567_c0~~gnl/TRDRNA2_/TRDRNA2_69567_c0_seq1.p1  ORF type:complete len:284 (+),score=106.20 gnl/TRDRNA2_/TRDRNA2_69567_c0_seq1:58-909(+)